MVAIEVKLAEKWDRSWSKPMRSLSGNAAVKVDRMIGVYCGSRSYVFDGIYVFPVETFVQALFAGEIF